MADEIETLRVRLERSAAATRRSAELNQSDRETRDELITKAERAGWSLRTIAKITGMSVSHIQKICYDSTVKAQKG